MSVQAMKDERMLAFPARPHPAPFRLALLLVPALAAGCGTTGPVTVRQDRFNFNKAGAESTKEQILLNIVRLRYGEPIYFVDIGSMLSHYSFNVGARYQRYLSDLNVWNSPTLRALYNMRGEPVPGSNTWDANVDYTDSPTITYTPISGEEFSRRVMAPIPPTTIIYLSESGWSIDRIFDCCVQQINDVGNAPVHELDEPGPVDTSRFQRVAALLKKIQDAGYLRSDIERAANENETYLYMPPPPPELEAEAKELRELLGLPEGPPGKVLLRLSGVRMQPNEVAMQTRSLLAAMYALARTIPVPAEHAGRLPAASCPSAEEPETGCQWLRVEHSRLPQINPFAQVYYDGYWFYVDNSDWSSKRTFALLTYLFSLQATAKGETGPLLTVPAGR
jgi:hypothetical protein